MKLADVCVARPVFAVMLIAFLVTLGIFSYRTLGVDLFPRADPATVYVGVELPGASPERSEEHTSELQSRLHLVCRLLLEKKKKNKTHNILATRPCVQNHLSA